MSMIATFILGGISGCIVSACALIRNVLTYFNLMNKLVLTGLLAVTVTAGLILNANGVFGLLPLVATIEYSVILALDKSVTRIKIALALNTLLWGIYGLIIKDYVGCITEIAITIICTGNLIIEKYKKYKSMGKAV